jgi:hypothetical protein
MSSVAETVNQPARAPDDLARQVAYAKQLLTGRGAPLDRQRGAGLIADAARHGDAEAAALAALLIGLGARSEENWKTAAEYLQQAAECGWQPAQEQLAVLSTDRDLAQRANDPSPSPDLWGRLRRSIDFGEWDKLPERQQMSTAPDIAIFESFLPARFCRWIIERARPRLERSRIYGASGAPLTSDTRTNSAFEFDVLSLDLPMLLVRARIAAATGSPVPLLEQTNVLHYSVGQEFARHFDFLDPALAGHAQEIAARGQRIATFLIYLCEDYAGGETDFPLLKQRHRPAAGGALFFRNVDSAGAVDRKTLHAGLPPTSGEKWLLSQWIRGPRPAA